MPGPGTYEPPNSISKTGNYFNSKFKNSKWAMFNPAVSKRFTNYSRNYKQIPGPGTYNPGTSITKDGNYFLSRFSSSRCRTFYHCDRDTSTGSKNSKNLPGPGMYRLPSDFGYYEKAKKNTVKKKRRARSVEAPGDRKNKNN